MFVRGLLAVKRGVTTLVPPDSIRDYQARRPIAAFGGNSTQELNVT